MQPHVEWSELAARFLHNITLQWQLHLICATLAFCKFATFSLLRSTVLRLFDRTARVVIWSYKWSTKQKAGWSIDDKALETFSMSQSCSLIDTLQRLSDRVAQLNTEIDKITQPGSNITANHVDLSQDLRVLSSKLDSVIRACQPTKRTGASGYETFRSIEVRELQSFVMSISQLLR